MIAFQNDMIQLPHTLHEGRGLPLVIDGFIQGRANNKRTCFTEEGWSQGGLPLAIDGFIEDLLHRRRGVPALVIDGYIQGPAKGVLHNLFNCVHVLAYMNRGS
jgi:hypothetical protein